jgi:hypothetical protein
MRKTNDLVETSDTVPMCKPHYERPYHLAFNFPTTRHEGAWGERQYRSYSFLTSALDWGEWSGSRPGRSLAPGKGPPVPIG